VYSEVWWRNLWEGDHLEESDVDGTIILKWVFEKWDGGGGHELGLSGSGQGQMVGSCEFGNDLLGSVMCGKFLD
jgi:hypothetical protein